MSRLLQLAEPDLPIVGPLQICLDAVASRIEEQLASDLPSINNLCRYIERYRGKMLRPAMVLLSGLAVEGNNDPQTLTDNHTIIAAVTELIHMATLVHDDVLDDANIRRRGETINALHGNETAVMLGDYLISNAFHLCSKAMDPKINLALGHITNTLCEGELLQLHHRNQLGIDEPTYFEIVKRKTASLIGEACALGSQLSNASATQSDQLREAGIALGIAFQIQDDVLDLVGDQHVVGKSLGRDLDKGKLTLPLILYLASTDQRSRGMMLEMIEARDAEEVRHTLVVHGTVEQSTRRAIAHVEKALETIKALPPSDARDLLQSLASRIVRRDF